MTGVGPRPFTADLNWRSQAACQGKSGELFFTSFTGRLGAAHNERAKNICSGCPVVAKCLAWALDAGEDWGVWGNTTPEERRTIRRRRKRQIIGEPEPVKQMSVRARYEAGLPCARGHELTEDTVRVRGEWRECRTCNTENEAARRQAVPA